jgi:hydroxyethylthiazole kinase-like uncharacterized protein yjeF
MLVVTSAQMRALDRLTIDEYGTPGHVLMERAGKGATEVFWDEFRGVRTRPVIIAGKGNNGGDGFVVARCLRARGVRCDVVLLARADDVGGDAARNLRAFKRARGRIIEAPGEAGAGAVRTALERGRVVIDAIFGTGLNAPVTGPIAQVISLINASGLPVFAIDIPSGLDADRGEPLGIAVQAEATATFGFPKVGQLLYPGAGLVGTLAVVDIGIAPEAIATVAPTTRLLTAAEVGARLGPRRPDAHKGDCGHVLVIAGGRGKFGAAMLAAEGAARAGAGLTTLALPTTERVAAGNRRHEIMTAELDGDADGLFAAPVAAKVEAVLAGKSCVVVGPGIGVSEGTSALVRWLVTHCAVPLVIDADGLNCLAGDTRRLRERPAPTVLTPHPGEMSRLAGVPVSTIQGDRLGVARRFAADTGTCVILKGARTIIAPPDGPLGINPTGNPGMASGGMGDVLSGIVGALCAQGLAADEAAALGVYVHGLAADLAADTQGGEIGLMASDVLDVVPRAIAVTQNAARAAAEDEEPARKKRMRQPVARRSVAGRRAR